MDDGADIALHTWIPDGDIKGVVQLSHGMAEFAKRYDRFGTILADQGYVFYAHDHRGHGESVKSTEELGYLADKDGFQRVVLDLRSMIEKAHTDFPGKKVFLFGHSFGSFVSQSFMEQFGREIDGCMLCGSAGPRIPLTAAGSFLAKVIKCFKGGHYRSTFINGMAFGSYTKRITDTKSQFAWISRDYAELKKYEDDPYCGFLCTVEFFADFFSGLTEIGKIKNIKKIPRKLPVYIFSGEEDPVGEYGQSVAKLNDIYKKIGMEDLSFKLYPEARHELLNELNHEEVEKNILDWIKART
ncbi:MAG: alpha/beta hydrolase [Treponemataceae bacterium]|nr:alpha/beta hydrolase [Treponemataceae bacterium]